MHIPGYQILEEIGRGGMSTVYRAVQESLQREVALKVLSPELAKETEYCEQLINEGKIVARLAHPNIVTIYDLGAHAGNYYLSMEYVTGGSLRELLDETKLTQQETLRIFTELAEILAYSHQQGVVHMDIKPRNILLRANGGLVLTDFGIAQHIETDIDLEAPSFFHASPKYMSPEQVRGRVLDKRTDIYSLGIIFYEMLMQKVPYVAQDAIAIAKKHLSDPIPVLPDHLQNYQQLLSRLIAKNPADRLPNMERVIETTRWVGGKRPDEVGGDTDQLSRADLIAELDRDEEVMNIELTEDGETTVAISSAFAALDVHSAIQNETQELRNDTQEFAQAEPITETEIKLENVRNWAAEEEWQAEEDLARAQFDRANAEALDLPDLSNTTLIAAESRPLTTPWTKVFVPAAAAMLVAYLAIVQLIPAGDVNAASVPDVSIDKVAVETDTPVNAIDDAKQVLVASAEQAGPVTRFELLDDDIEKVLNESAGMLANDAEIDALQPASAERATEILELANEKSRLEQEIAELERLVEASRQQRLARELAEATSSADNADNQTEAVTVVERGPQADAVEEYQYPVYTPEQQVSVSAGTVVENPVVADADTPSAALEQTMVASVEYEPLNSEPDDVPATLAPYETVASITNTSDYYSDLQQEVVEQQRITDAQLVDAVAQDIIPSEEPSTIYQDISADNMIDLGVVREGEILVMDRALEQKLREYAVKVDRLADGRLRLVLDQQNLYRPDSTELDMEARLLLDRLSYVLRNYSGFSVNVIDRTAQNGSLRTRNLSWGRAKTASSYLVAQGMEQPRIQHRGNSVNESANNIRGLELILAPMI